MFNKLVFNYLFSSSNRFILFKKNISTQVKIKTAPFVFNSFLSPYKKAFISHYRYTPNFHRFKRNSFKHIYSFSNVTIHTKKTRNCFAKYFYIPYAEKHLGLLAKSTKPFHKNQLLFFFFSTIHYFSNILYWNPYQKYFNYNRFFVNGVFLKTLWFFLKQGDVVSTSWVSNIYVLRKKRLFFAHRRLFFNFFLRYRVNNLPAKKSFPKKYHSFYLELRQLNPIIFFFDKRTNALLVIKHRAYFEDSNNHMNFGMFSLYGWKILT